MTSIPQAFYAAYLRQDTTWPSSSAGGDIEISSMHPAQAINSYHRLLEGMDDRSAPVNRGVYSSPLAMALLTQAVGEAVVYAADLDEPEVAPAPFEFSLEECRDLINDLDDFDVVNERKQQTAPRARYLQVRLNRIQGGPS